MTFSEWWNAFGGDARANVAMTSIARAAFEAGQRAAPPGLDAADEMLARANENERERGNWKPGSGKNRDQHDMYFFGRAAAFEEAARYLRNKRAAAPPAPQVQETPAASNGADNAGRRAEKSASTKGAAPSTVLGTAPPPTVSLDVLERVRSRCSGLATAIRSYRLHRTPIVFLAVQKQLDEAAEWCRTAQQQGSAGNKGNSNV